MHAKQDVVREGPTIRVSALLKVGDVAELLSCSERTVYRLADSGRMPAPIKLGAMVRWPREQVESWVVDGCPKIREAVRS